MEVEEGEGEIGGLEALGRGEAIPLGRERVAALLSGRGRGDLADHELGLRVAVLRHVDELAVGEAVVARGKSGLACGEIGMGGGTPEERGREDEGGGKPTRGARDSALAAGSRRDHHTPPSWPCIA